MPFGNGARPLMSSISLPTPGLIVAQEAPLHHYYALANELTESARQWNEAQESVTPQMASSLADMTMAYPDLPASVLTGAAAGGIPVDHPALSSLNERMGYARTLSPVSTAGENILSVPFDFIRGGIRIATTAFASLYEEGAPRHARQVVGMSQGMSGQEARELSGESFGVRAVKTFFNDPIGNLTPLPSSPEGQVNLGSGWLPKSNVADAQTAEVQMAMQMGIPEANAIAQVQQAYGDPLTQIAYEQAHTGITFDDGMSVSPGRLAAKGIGLEAGTMPFYIASGAADFGSQLFLDPTNLALWGVGKARLANKMLVGGASRRGLLGIHVDDYLGSPAYNSMTETVSRMGLNEDVANALGVKHLSPDVEGFSVRSLVADATDANTPEKVDKVLRPYFGSTEGSLPMFQQVPTPRSIMNPSGTRRTMGQILGGGFKGTAGDVGQTFGLKAAVGHNLEGTWAGRMFSKMPGGVVVVDDLDRGYEQVRAYANSMGMSPEESHPFLQAFARLRNGDGVGAQKVVDNMNKFFVEEKIPGLSDALKQGFLKTWKRWDHNRKYWVGEAGQNQWFPDVQVYGVVDNELITISKPAAQQVNELYNNTIPLINPREIRNALSDEGVLKIARLTSKEMPVPGTSALSAGQTELVERMWVNVLDGYMQKVWKPFVLLRVAWPVRVVFEEQLRMAAAGLDSMFNHPLSWIAYTLGGKMNKTLLGESLEVAGKNMDGMKAVYDFTPGGTFDSFSTAMSGKGGPFLDSSGVSLGQINYVNVWQDSPGFADAWLWNMAKNHQDPVQAYLRTNGIDATVDWLQKGGGRTYLRQLLETSGPEKAAFLAGGKSPERLRWYVEGLHARSVKLGGGDYVYWNPHVQSAVIPEYKGGWLSSADRPLVPDELAKHKLDPHGPATPDPIPVRPKPDGGTGPSPVDGLPEGGKPPSLGDGPSGTQRLPFAAGGGEVTDTSLKGALADLIKQRERAMTEFHTIASPEDADRLATYVQGLRENIDDVKAQIAARAQQPEVPIQPRINQFDRPFSANDPVKVKAASGKAKDKSYNTMGYQDSSNGYDSNRAFASLFNDLSERSSYSIDEIVETTTGNMDTSIATIDDLARNFMGPNGVVDDVALTDAFNLWVKHANIDGDSAEHISRWMVEAINIRHQQQLDMMNYVYPGRMSIRQEAFEALTDSKMYDGVKLIADDLTPEQTAELRFIYRFIETMTANETAWGRSAMETVDYVFKNFNDEFVRLNKDSAIVRRLIDESLDQQTLRPKPVGFEQIHPRGASAIDDIPEIALRDIDGNLVDKAGKAIKAHEPGEPMIISGYAMVDGGPDNLGIYSTMAAGRARAAITIDDYVTVDIGLALEQALDEIGEVALRGVIEDIAKGASSTHEIHVNLVRHLTRELDIPGKNGAVIFQGKIDDSNIMFKGVSNELKGLFNDLNGAWFKDYLKGVPDDILQAGERRVIIGGYDGVWSPDDQAAMVRALTQGGTFTKQGSESLAKLVNVLQRRDAGLTQGWLEAFGKEIAGSNRLPPQPKGLGSLHQLETATTKDLSDELIQLAASFHAKEVAADDVIEALMPGAHVHAFTGIEARLVEISDELSRRYKLVSDLLENGNTAAIHEFETVFTDAIQKYAQFSETSSDEIFNIVEWVDDLAGQIDMSFAPSRAVWPRHAIDEFDEVSQPHMYYNDAFENTIDGASPAKQVQLRASWDALSDDAEVWVFHATDPYTARRWLVDGINPLDKPLNKTGKYGDYKPGQGMDQGTYAGASPQALDFYAHAAAQRAGAGYDGTIIAVKVRKGDLYVPGEGASWEGMEEVGGVFNALTHSGVGAAFSTNVPPGNIRMFGIDSLSEGPWRAAKMKGIVGDNINAGAALSDDAQAAVRMAENAGYRVEVVATADNIAEIWIMDRDRVLRILDREIDTVPIPGKGKPIKIGVDDLDPDDMAGLGSELAQQMDELLVVSSKSPGYGIKEALESGDWKGVPRGGEVQLVVLKSGAVKPATLDDYRRWFIASHHPDVNEIHISLHNSSEFGWEHASEEFASLIYDDVALKQMQLGNPIHVEEFIPGGGRRVLDDPDITGSMSDAIVVALNNTTGVPAGTGVVKGTIPFANAPRPGFRYLLEQPYGSPRFKKGSGIHYDDGSQIDIDNLSIMGTAKAELKTTLPDAPKPKAEPPMEAPRQLAIEPGKQPPALGAGEPVPPGGYATSGGASDELFQGEFYKIIEGQTETGRKMIGEGTIEDPTTGELMDLFPSGTVDNYAADMEGLPARHAALKENLDSAPPVLPTPNPEYAANNVGVWDKAIDSLFYYLMSVPTNKLSRAPAWKQFYLEKVLHLRSFADDATRTKLDAAIKNDLGVGDLEKWRRDPTSVGRVFAPKDDTTKGISMTFEQIDQIAKGYALENTKSLLYDMTQKHDASDVLRNVFPFAEAWGEIITAWSKIMWENPRMFRRAQQGVEAAREQGWFYNDGNGNEVFAYPGSAFVTNAMMGTGEKSSVQLTGTTAGVNLALGQYVPGFGPIVQVPASMLLPDMPKFDAIKKFLMPYGDQEVQTPGDIINLGLPAWYERALVAIGTSTANYQRLHNNTVMDIYKVLAAEHPEKMNNEATARALMDEASSKASMISWLRAGAAIFSPTSPQIEYSIEDSEGTMWQMQVMTAEYYRLLRTNDFDQELALTDFIRRFGFGEGLTDGLGVASTFITAKSIKVQERGTTTDAYSWQRDNADLFEQGQFPYTAAYAMQDLEWDDFDYTAYLDGLKKGTRESLSPDEWLMRRNALVGNIAYDHAKAQVAGRTDREARLWKRDMRIKLANEYPGFDVDIAGLPMRPDTETQIMELERWAEDERLSQSSAGQGSQVYLALRRRAEAEAYNLGLMPDSWRTASSMVEWRNWLRQSAEAIMQVYPEFGQLWFDVFRWELTEDETPETLALGGMTF